MADEETKAEQQSAEQAATEGNRGEDRGEDRSLEGALRELFGPAVLGWEEFRGQRCVLLDSSVLLDACRWLRDERGFRYLADVIAVDYPAHPKRFEVVYQLYAHEHAERLRLKVRAADGELVPSVTRIWAGAQWPERECFDLMGVRFSGHPDLRRILLPEEASGHPLRKDYPLRGRSDLGFKVERGGRE